MPQLILISDAAAGYAFFKEKGYAQAQLDQADGFIFNLHRTAKVLDSMRDCLEICNGRADCESFEYEETLTGGFCRMSSKFRKPGDAKKRKFSFYVKGKTVLVTMYISHDIMPQFVLMLYLC